MQDSFVRDNLPSPDLWPDLDWDGLDYPPRLNCVAELLKDADERPALWFGDTLWSAAHLTRRIDRIARVLVEDWGLIPGNRVLLRGPNNPMMVACWLAVAKMGGVVVATMPLLRAVELAAIVEKAEISHCLCDASLAEELDLTRERCPRLTEVLHFTAQGEGDSGLDRALATKPAQFSPCDTAADEPVLIAFTSGTTGSAKGTVHSHRDMLAVCDTFARHLLDIRPSDIFLGTPPLAFTFGLGAQVLFPLRFGASTVLVEKFGPTTIAETIARHRCTGLYTAPTGYRALAALAGDYDLSSLRLCVSAGEHLPKSTWEAWLAATGLAIIDGIGSTEMLHIFIAAAGSDIRPGATGKVVPGYRARITDADGTPLPPDSEGWLCVKGPTGCRYLADTARQAVYVKDGWNVTGDIYRMDADGYFWFVARGDDMIISAGYNISGPEVENALLAHPKVAECAVVAAPDEERGHIVKAYVVLEPNAFPTPATTAELQAHVKAAIAPYKYPRAIEFRDHLPRTPTGKLQRFRLREEARRG